MILIALGANLPSSAGNSHQTLVMALRELALLGVVAANQSRFYRSPAWPDASDPPFVNAVASVDTKLNPSELLQVLHQVEARFGRVRGKPNAPRTLDLDLLDYEGRVEPGPPILPHPRMEERAFVLVPLRDVAPLWRHPRLGLTVDELIQCLPVHSINLFE